MRTVLSLLLLVITLAGSAGAQTPTPAPQPAEPPKTLAECVSIALAQHPSLKAAGASVQAGHARVFEATSSYLPQVSSFYNASRGNSASTSRTSTIVLPSVSGTVPAAPSTVPAQTVNASTVTFNFYRTGVSFSQILFDFGQTLNQIRAAQAAEQSLRADLNTQAETVALNVKQAYFNVLATRRLQTVADETVRQNQSHLDQARGRYTVGLAAKFDVTTAEVQLANAELNQLSARNNVAVARETLRNALGLTGPLTFDIIDNLDIHAVQISEQDALALAYEKRPELQSFQAQERAAGQQIAALQKNYLPNVTGNGAYQWSGTDYPLDSNWSIGASVNLSLFSGGLTTAQIAEQKANLSNLAFNEELTRQNIALEVRQDTLNLQQAAASIGVAEKGLQLARENLALAEGRYKTGVGNIIELTDAQASLTTAEANNVQALYNYKTALAALEKATAQQLTSD
jgi:outer membrane protein